MYGAKNQSDRVFKLRSIEHVIQLIKVFEIENNSRGLNQTYHGVYGCNIPIGLTFRVTCERVGKHDFTSIDVQKVAGDKRLLTNMDGKLT